MEILFNICRSNLGICRYDTDDDAMIRIASSPDKSQWLALPYEEAHEISRVTGWKCKKVDVEVGQE
jgi:hypothetical protein